VKRFVYFYLMRETPDVVNRIIPVHVQYWETCNLPEYVGGPFADRTCGLITFSAARLEDAQRIIEDDPFVLENLIEQKWIKQWHVE